VVDVVANSTTASRLEPAPVSASGWKGGDKSDGNYAGQAKISNRTDAQVREIMADCLRSSSLNISAF